jgi:hypothetical protein
LQTHLVCLGRGLVHCHLEPLVELAVEAGGLAVDGLLDVRQALHGCANMQ